MAIVLDNPLSHAVMEKIVVSLKNSLHDKSEMVRAVFLDLLIKMKEVRAAKVDCVSLCGSKCVVHANLPQIDCEVLTCKDEA